VTWLYLLPPRHNVTATQCPHSEPLFGANFQWAFFG
jgi:hypothetical protein